jgi:hypothetical protein
MFAAISGWPRREKSRPRVFFGFLATRTTRVRPAAVLESRSGGASAKRGKVPPFIEFVNWELVVRGVCGVNLTRTIASDKRAECLVKQRRVICVGTQSPCLL